MIKIPNDMVVGTHHMTNSFGELEIVEYQGYLSVRVRFINTGYEPVVAASDIRKGGVKDKLAPSVHGAGYVGDGKFVPYVGGKPTKIYATWKSMLERCYDKKFQAKRPTYTGCSVVPEWHNFQTFAEWMGKQDYEGKHLDKDIKVKGNKVYGPNTCSFVSPTENSVEAHAKHYTFISPEGEMVEVYNLTEFCRENGLDRGAMTKVRLGKHNQHKGWRKA